MTNQWDRRPKETPAAWLAFQAYRDLGPKRSLADARAKTGARPGAGRRWERWSSQHNWVTRCAAYDARLDGAKQAAAITEAEAIGRRHAQLGRLAQGVAAKGLEAIDKNPERLKGSEAAALLKAGVDIERIAEGLNTASVRHEGTVVIKKIDLAIPRPKPEE